MIKANVVLPQAYMTLADFGYHVYVLWDTFKFDNYFTIILNSFEETKKLSLSIKSCISRNALDVLFPQRVI